MSEATNDQTEANRKTIRDAFETWKEGTGAIIDVFAPEMVWRIEGRSFVSKTYDNKQQFINEVLAPFSARFASSSDPFRPVTIRSVYADEDTVIVLWDGRGVANDGKPYENSYAWFLKMRDCKVIDGVAFYDSISFNDLWSRVQAR
jgi:ketosteroid isomerase-like protein